MKLDMDDLRAILLVDIPHSLRLIVLIFLILTAYGTGLVYSYVSGHQVASERAQHESTLVDLRNQVRHLWGAFEYVKTRQDRTDLQVIDLRGSVRKAREQAQALRLQAEDG